MDVRELEKGLEHKLGPYVRFIGVYASDRIPFIHYSAKPVLLIANTLKSGTDINTIGHWVAFYFEFQPQKRVIFFDSYGIPPQFYINSGFSNFLKKYNNTPIYHYGKQLQPDNSMKCGLYFLLFIHSISHLGLKDFTKFLYNRFTFKKRELTYNDKYVTRYYFKYLSKSNCSQWKTGDKRAITYKECISNIGEKLGFQNKLKIILTLHCFKRVVHIFSVLYLMFFLFLFSGD